MSTVNLNSIVALATDSLLIITGGSVSATSLTITRSGMRVRNGGYFTSDTLVMSNGFLDISQRGAVLITTTLSITCASNGVSPLNLLAGSWINVLAGNTVLTGVNTYILVAQQDSFASFAGTNVTITGTTMSTTRCIFASRNCIIYLIVSGTVTMNATATPGGASISDMSFLIISAATWTHTANMTMGASNASLGRVAPAVGNAVFTPAFATTSAQLAQWQV
jgi:hypothetical protein